jgi:hypothetical protein
MGELAVFGSSSCTSWIGFTGWRIPTLEAFVACASLVFFARETLI